ncbi:MAG: hypothetical protein II830_01185 [Alphaproteobacteria bacterium]|nr:hypothetical protein [Alphaproteobacteria bacterium]
MDTLFSFFEMLMSFGNWAFWLVAVLLMVMATIVYFYGEMNYIVPYFTVEKHPFLQQVLRFSFLLILVLCLFVDCDHIFHGLEPPVGKAVCVYITAFIGFYFAMGFYFFACLLIYCVGRIVYWALDKEWHDD